MAGILRFTPTAREVLPSRGHVLRRIKCPSDPGEDLDRRIDAALELLAGLAEPAGFALDLSISNNDGSEIALENGLVLSSSMLARRLSGAVKLSLLLATLGDGPEERASREAEQGSMLDSMIIEGAASAMVEELLRETHLWTASRMVGFEGTARYSPGYGDFSLEHQRVITSAMGETGVKVLEGSFILQPRKSATAVIGWRAEA